MKVVGLLEAAGLTCYIVFIVLCMNFLSGPDGYLSAQNEILAGIVMLMMFVVSALVSASIILAYPAALFLNNKRGAAVKIVIWSIAWLVIFEAVFLVAGAFFM